MRLLVCIDLSESTDPIIKKTEEFAKALSAKVWIMHVAKPMATDIYMAGLDENSAEYEMDPQVMRDSLAKRFHNEHRQTQAIADQWRNAGLDTTALFLEGEAADTILEEASKLDVDIIVVGTHGHGAMYHLLMGSVSEDVLRKSDRPVLVVPTHERG
jgi:nucleotide-binding universal stress UspA family protein